MAHVLRSATVEVWQHDEDPEFVPPNLVWLTIAGEMFGPFPDQATAEFYIPFALETLE